MTPKPINFEKLRAYRGSVLKELKAPDNYRSYVATCRKLIKVYLRMHQDEIFYPELVSTIKEAASVLRFMGLSRYRIKVPDNLIDYLEEISTCNIKRWLEMKHNLVINTETEVLVEETREKVNGTHCSFCKIELYFPSYVIHRTEEKILHKSSPIGIKCLRSQQGKLKKFLDGPQVVEVLQEMKEALTV